MAHRETFISWLQDAYAMEKGLIEVLEAHRDQADGYPDVQAKIKEHLAQTREHADRIEKCLHELKESPSGVKSAISGFMGNMAGVTNAMPEDRIVKNGIADFAAEHMEIATYNALIVAARELEYETVASVCEEILVQEQEMADWLEENLPIAVRTFLEEKRAEDVE